jgi:hypothetical protein
MLGALASAWLMNATRLVSLAERHRDPTRRDPGPTCRLGGPLAAKDFTGGTNPRPATEADYGRLFMQAM